MRYFIRSVKYFLSMFVVIFLILEAFAIFQYHSFNVLDSLRQTEPYIDGFLFSSHPSIQSALLICIMIALFSAIYPLFGYAERPLDVRGDTSEIESVIRQYMEERGYRLEKETLDLITFRVRNPFTRFLRVFEDRISFRRTHTGFTIEGLNKEIVRLKSIIEYRYQNRDIL